MAKGSTEHTVKKLSNAFKQAGLDVQIQIRRTSLGWMKLTLISSAFQGKSQIERERQIDEILETIDLNLGGYPFLDYMLYTPQEAPAQEEIQPIQLPLWSEILLAPEPEHPVFPNEDVSKLDEDRAFVATFYSFKGGVGRSTALGLVANLLVASGRRVVMLDFDLEAPGISFMFPSSLPSPMYGVLDYVYQRYLMPEENQPLIADCIRRVDTPFRGELYLIPAGEFDEGYIHKLADLDVRFLYNQERNPLQQLLADVKTELEPDVILIDARTGFTEMGAIALFDQADLGIICFSPTNQNFEGLKWVVKAASKQRSYNGIPDLRFLLTPMPTVAQSQQQLWVSSAAEWIAEYWEIPLSVSIDELYYQIPYNPNITTLTSLVGNMQPGILEVYQPIADTITASLPEKKSSVSTSISDHRQTILTELKFIADVAQDIAPTEIPKIFQRTDDFSKFLQGRTWLVTGAKGTGKTLLFRLFIERPEDARKLAASDANLQNVDFIPGHGSSGLRNTLLAGTNLESYEHRAGSDKWPLFWLNYVLLQLVASLPAIQQLPFIDSQLAQLCQQKSPRQTLIIDWLVNRTSDPRFASDALDELNEIDRWLAQQNKKVWLLYDELDAGWQNPGQTYQENAKRRRRALESLMGWWLEHGPALQSITPKILLRGDIWNELNFNNKVHLTSRLVPLQWEEDDLWRMVLRQALQSSPAFTTLVHQQTDIEVEKLDRYDLSQLRAYLYPLWGRLMGRVNKAYTYNWIRKRISDSKNDRFPRSLVQLLEKAIEIEKKTMERNPYETVLRPRSLIDALPFVSEQRVIEVKNEYPEFEELLNKLRDEKSPIPFDHLKQRWRLDDDNILRSRIKGMIDAGILAEYQPRSQENEIQRYSVAELYLYGLGMQRQGPR
jgi:MinD-like ATPase involved in chromosome partitioning or flagellar assembly/stress-induced morphogen